MSNHWNNRYLNGDTPWLNDNEIISPLKTFFEINRDVKLNILEIGCATGKHSNWLANLGHNVVGIDISEKAIKEANKVCSPASFLCGDFVDVEITENVFDVVIDINTFRVSTLNEEDRLVFTNNIYKGLKPNGIWFNVTSKPNEMVPNIPNRDISYLTEITNKQFEIKSIESFTSIASFNKGDIVFENWFTTLQSKKNGI